MRVLSSMLILVLLIGCATVQPTEADLALRRINEERLRNYTPHPPVIASAAPESVVVTPPAAETGPSAVEVIGTILLLPIIIPVAIGALAIGAVAQSGGYSRGIHCKSYTYKDQYHTKCY